MFARFKLVPRRLRTEARFQAPDPVYGNRETEFSIESFPFLPILLGVSVAAGLLAAILILPLVLARWNRRKRQMQGALARLGGGRVGVPDAGLGLAELAAPTPTPRARNLSQPPSG